MYVIVKGTVGSFVTTAAEPQELPGGVLRPDTFCLCLRYSLPLPQVL